MYRADEHCAGFYVSLTFAHKEALHDAARAAARTKRGRVLPWQLWELGSWRTTLWESDATRLWQVGCPDGFVARVLLVAASGLVPCLPDMPLAQAARTLWATGPFRNARKGPLNIRVPPRDQLAARG